MFTTPWRLDRYSATLGVSASGQLWSNESIVYAADSAHVALHACADALKTQKVAAKWPVRCSRARMRDSMRRRLKSCTQRSTCLKLWSSLGSLDSCQVYSWLQISVSWSSSSITTRLGCVRREHSLKDGTELALICSVSQTTIWEEIRPLATRSEAKAFSISIQTATISMLCSTITSSMMSSTLSIAVGEVQQMCTSALATLWLTLKRLIKKMTYMRNSTLIAVICLMMMVVMIKTILDHRKLCLSSTQTWMTSWKALAASRSSELLKDELIVKASSMQMLIKLRRMTSPDLSLWTSLKLWPGAPMATKISS